MWNRILSSLVVAAAALPVAAQTIKPVEAPVSTYIELLKDNGYDAYSFDISALRDTTYFFQVIVKEYEGDKLVGDDSKKFPYALRSRNMLSNLNPKFRATLKPEDMADAEKGIFALAERIDVGLLPPADSVRRVGIMMRPLGAMYRELNLKEQFSPDGKESSGRAYAARPFKLQNFKAGEFIPLVLVGSTWWDPQINFFRFCGDSEIDPDLSSEIVKNIPHYYVIGVVATKQQDK